jgi:hypothetical protein
MARHVQAPEEYEEDGPSLFLAGGITGTVDWQAQAAAALDDLPIAILNPRRPVSWIDDPVRAAEQVAWEYRHLRRARALLWWFTADQIQPIALFELGAHARADRQVVVGADERYPRRQDVILQLGLARPDVTVHSTLEETLTAARKLLGAAAR